MPRGRHTSRLAVRSHLLRCRHPGNLGLLAQWRSPGDRSPRTARCERPQCPTAPPADQLALASAGLFQQVVEFAPEALAQVCQLLAGGDVLSAPHVQRLLQYGHGQTISNGYGPTENTTFTVPIPCKPLSKPRRPYPLGVPSPTPPATSLMPTCSL